MFHSIQNMQLALCSRNNVQLICMVQESCVLCACYIEYYNMYFYTLYILHATPMCTVLYNCMLQILLYRPAATVRKKNIFVLCRTFFSLDRTLLLSCNVFRRRHNYFPLLKTLTVPTNISSSRKVFMSVSLTTEIKQIIYRPAINKQMISNFLCISATVQMNICL